MNVHWLTEKNALSKCAVQLVLFKLLFFLLSFLCVDTFSFLLPPDLQLVFSLECESAAIHMLDYFATLTSFVLVIAPIFVSLVEILRIIPAHLLQMQIAAMNLIRTLEYLLEEALSHVLADKDHVVHEVLKHCKLVLLAVS